MDEGRYTDVTVMKGTLREEADLDLHNRVGGEAKCDAMQLKRRTGLDPSDSDTKNEGGPFDTL